MKYLLQIAASIAQGKRDKEIKELTRDRQSKIEKEIIILSNDDIDEFLGNIFPNGIPTDSCFYNSLEEVQYYIGYKPLSQKFIETLWVNAYNRLSPEGKKIDMLKSLLDEKQIGMGFWSAVHSLPEFCSQVEIDPQFAALWFFELAERVKGDLAGGDVFKAVKEYAYHFPNFGLRVFEQYVSEGLGEPKLNLAANLFGALRSSASQGRIKKEVIEKWENQLKDNPKTEFRLCYHQSWVTSFDLGTVSIEQLDAELSKMLSGVQEEIDAAFNTIYRSLRGNLSDPDFVRFTMKWFSRNASSRIPPLAKYCVVDAMWHLCSIRGKEPGLVKVSDANNLLIAIQPIPNDNLGTWHQLEYYLLDRFNEGPEAFEDIFTKLAEANTEGLLAQLEGRGFDYLKSEMSKLNIKELMTNWLISLDHRMRRIGALLFREIKLDSLSEKILFKADEIQLEFALLEFVRQPFWAEKTSQYLLMLEPHFRRVSPELQNMFKHEMLMQAINYPGTCLEIWKQISNPSELLQDVIKSTEQYFENLTGIKDSPAINFSFPGYKNVAEESYREFSYQVAQSAREQSIFAQLAKNVEIIYGSRWSIMVEGKLGEDMPFKKYGPSMEFPRVEEIDPEGMALRRIQASAQIKDLENTNVAN